MIFGVNEMNSEIIQPNCDHRRNKIEEYIALECSKLRISTNGTKMNITRAIRR